MAQAWTFSGAPPASEGGPELVTLVEGSTFCISASSGNVIPGAPMGLFVRDTRLVAHWELVVDGGGLEPLAVSSQDPFLATFVTRARPRPGQPESTLLVTREREIGEGMTEVVRLRNLGHEVAGVTLELKVASDFADLFEVKEGKGHATDGVVCTVIDGGLLLRHERDGHSRSARVVADSTDRLRPTSGRLVWQLAIAPRDEWSVTLAVDALVDDVAVSTRGGDDERTAARRFAEWRGGAPLLSTPDAGLGRTLGRSMEDLGALRIVDPEHPGRAVVAAGAPWYMALFGRDSLLSAWMVLPLDLRLALGTLQALAEVQGTQDDPFTEEQPGKILHELRLGPTSSPMRGGATVYYGSIDSTPLFVMLLGELRRWGLAADEVDALLPAADRALEWMVTRGDRDGDGFLEYERATDRGLRNQGWKDSSDSVNFADGRLAVAPIALAEAQGYAYSAYLARAHFAREFGDEVLASQWATRAADLKAAFNDLFWLPDRGYFAVGLDRDKRPIDALASNMGHCLWTGIVDEELAGSVVDALMSPEMFSGWGIRTLATTMGAYNPMSYHNGSVWPHDNALIVAGMVRYGYTEQAQLVAQGIFDAAATFGGRLPELFCGFDRAEFTRPVPYPTACSPQAWAAATPVLLLRSLLRFDPSVPTGEVRLAPAVPSRYLPLEVSNIMLAGRRVSLEVTAEGFSLDGLSRDIAVVPEPRHPSTEMLP
jgi:glycogen debranching enzyme